MESSAYSLDVAMKAASEVPGVETQTIYLSKKKINFCIHCNKCLRDNVTYCSVYKDDMSEFYEPFYNADGYIISSPVYSMCYTAQLGAFFNRFRATYLILKDDPLYFSKKVGGAIAVGGTRNGGQETTIAAIQGFYHTQGVNIVNGGIGMYAGVSVWSRDQGAKGAEEDEKGMENCRKLGKKLAETAILVTS